MKKRVIILFVTLFNMMALQWISLSALAQSPELLSYQAVIRTSNNQLDTNAIIGMRISILQGSSSGNAIYMETQESQTNENGLVTIQIGDGSVLSGSFSTINWANGHYFAKIETDLSGGTNYSITTVSQLLSVPYALYAKRSGSAPEIDPVFGASLASHITSADTAYWNQKLNGGHYIGELFGGGVVFYVDRSGQHGLICAMEVPPGYGQWSNVSANIGLFAQSDWNGQGNTSAILSQPGHINSAAKD
jgi:hypothetical protein